MMEIPDHYILKRWTKPVSVVDFVSDNECKIEDDPILETNDRYRNLCPAFVQLTTEAVESKEGYALTKICANEFAMKLKDIKKAKFTSTTEKVTPLAPESDEGSNRDDLFVNSTNVSKVKGIKTKVPTYRRNTRPKSFLEKAPKRKKHSPKQSSSSMAEPNSQHSVPYAPHQMGLMNVTSSCLTQQSQMVQPGEFSQLLRADFLLFYN